MLQGYDNWINAFPDDPEPELCLQCGGHEIERDEPELCNDCYYNVHHGAIVDALSEAIDELLKHFDTDKQQHHNRAAELIAKAAIKLEKTPK